MGLLERAAAVRDALLGVSAYASPKGYGLDLSDPAVEQAREQLGGNLQRQPITKPRWYLADLETATANADAGDLSMVGQLYRSMRRDGVISGLLGTLTSGVVRLPKRFYGPAEMVSALQAKNGTRSVFDSMCPPSELALLAADGRAVGVGVGELVPVAGRDYPVLCRLDPEFLRYRWNEGRWYFQSVAGMLPITPGDGRWVLHVPGGRVSPWQHALWPALGRAFINKEHALLHRSNYSAKLANPARAAVSPPGATEGQRIGWLKNVIAWGVNTVFDLPVGWDVKLIESNGRGFDVFNQEIVSSETECMVAIAGQIVTVTGGAGFVNGDLYKSIRSDIVQDTAEGLAFTLNTQVLPPWIVQRWGIDALAEAAMLEWDSRPPKDRVVEAQAMTQAAGAIAALDKALGAHGRELDVDQVTSGFGIPIRGDVDGDGVPDEQADDNVVELDRRAA